MKAVIFAAGLGTRLRPLTETTPKPLIDISGASILQRTLDALPASVNEALIVIGYKGNEIRRAPLAFRGKLTFIDQPQLRGTLDALRSARPFLRPGPFLVLNGDDLYAREDLEKLIAAAPYTMLAKRVPMPNAYSHLRVDEIGRLKAIVQNRDTDGHSPTLTYTGACLLDQRFFALVPDAIPNGEISLPHTLARHLNMISVRVIEAGFWMPVGTPAELDAARRAYDHR